ncbi:MAG: helix-turn-helix transcriptional regulator [Candidatus Binataceae bacterium]
MAANGFPPPVKLGTRTIRWRQSTIAAWLRERDGPPR